ncbi:glycosyltransferase [Halocella sp. SP3-1]|uniref:glycosyltransferase n=1 Tax=Halocella sp. SP3-1 TaxID=2382161 RepID=UPI000F7659C7|nr:glycosyltransferase [Halocella sp. SP3-1]AZO93885.1 glycosyltransferase [Halocella sp. SP3-1]
MKKIFFLNTCVEWGGGEKWTFETAQELAERGYEVVVGSVKESELFQRAKAAGMKTKAVPIKNSLSVLNPVKLFSFVNYLRDEIIEVLFMNLSQDLKFGGIAGKIAGIERIIYRRGLAIPIRDRFYTRFLLNNCITDIIANSYTIKKTILQNTANWLNENKIKVIYNGIKIKEIEDKINYQSNIRKEFNIKADTLLIASIGRLNKQKGHYYLIKAVKLIKKEIENFKVLIIGKGDLEFELKKQVEDLGLSDYVIFTGFRKDVFTILHQIDFLVHTALWEGCPNIILETMAMATPIVATGIPSVSEIMIDKETGYLTESENVEDIAKMVIKMIRNFDKKQFGQKARELIEREFDFKEKLNQLEKLIEENNY